MWKKILIGVLVLVVLLAAGMFYLNHRNRTLSPEGTVVFKQGALDLKIRYSRPSVKDRLIFGEGEGALQPYGKYWRLGANESTEMRISEPLMIMGKELSAGQHKIYCYPGKESFQFAFAPADGAWGYSEPDVAKEYFRVNIPVEMLNEPVEQFTISAQDALDGKGVDVHCDFSDHRLTLPFRPKS